LGHEEKKERVQCIYLEDYLEETMPFPKSSNYVDPEGVFKDPAVDYSVTRPGLRGLHYVRNCDIEQMERRFRNKRKLEGYNVFTCPHHLKAIGD